MRQKINKNLPIFALILFRFSLIAGTFLLFLDTFGNPDSVAKYLATPSWVLALLTILFALWMRLVRGAVLTRPLHRLFIFSAVFWAIATIVGTVFDFYSPPNTLFSLTKLHQSRLLFLSLYMGHVSLLGFNNNWWSKNWRKVILVYPFIMFGVVLLIRLFPFDYFFHISKEDTFFEILQVIILVSGGLITSWLAWRLKLKSKIKPAILVAISSLALFFVAGEEISWGQRIFNIEPTEEIQAINYQSEYTLHNLNFVQHKVFDMYLIICILAILTPWIIPTIKPLRKFAHFAPDKTLIGYFLSALIIYMGQFLGKTSLPWQESAEVFFYTGIVLWFIQLGLIFKDSKLVSIS